jgi:hypothetical protein
MSRVSAAVGGFLLACLLVVGLDYVQSYDWQQPPSTDKVEGTQFTRKVIKAPPRSPHYERWVDLPMNKPVRGTTRWYREAISPRIKCKDLGKPNRFDTLSEWDEPRISTARLCVRQGYHR